MDSYKNLWKQRAHCNDPSCTHPQLLPGSAGGQSCCISTPALCQPHPHPIIILEQILDLRLVHL